MLRKFSGFLDNNQRQLAMQQNDIAGVGLFSNLPLAPQEEDYFAGTDLLRELIEAKSAINIAIAELEQNNTLDENTLKQLVAEKFDLWIKKAFATAITELFDADGNVLPTIYSVLPYHENTDKFKTRLLGSYIMDVVIESESCKTSMQSLQLDKLFDNDENVLYTYFKIHVIDILIHYYNSTPTFNAKLIRIIHKNAEYIPPVINALFTESNDPMLTEQGIIAGLLGIKINQLLLKDFAKSGEIIELVLQDKRLINYVLKKFKLFGVENTTDDGLGFLYSPEFLPHTHTANNLNRAYNHVYDVFNEQLALHGYSSEIVLSPYATSLQREILILGAILWILPSWYIIKFYNPERAKTKDVFELLEIEKRFRSEPLLKLAAHYSLERFIPLLNAISSDYIPDHQALDAERAAQEFAKQVVIESLLCPAKTNNLFKQYNYILKANVLFPFELFRLQHHDQLTNKGDLIHASGMHAPACILDSSNIKTDKYLNAETEAYVAGLPIWQRFHVGAIVTSLHIAFTTENQMDENTFIAATREITVQQLSATLNKRQQADEEYINHFVTVFSKLETFDTGNLAHCSQFKEKFVSQIKQELFENNWFSKGKAFIHHLSKNCETFVDILEASKLHTEELQATPEPEKVAEPVINKPVTPPSSSRLKNGLAIAAIAAGLTLTIITASIFTAGLILVPIAIALFCIGGAMVGGSLIGAVVEYFKRNSTSAAPTTSDNHTSYIRLAEAGVRPERIANETKINSTPADPAPTKKDLNLHNHTATISRHPH